MASALGDVKKTSSDAKPEKIRGPVTWRSILLGLAGVLFICVLTPFNDYVLQNTSLVGSALPIGLMLFFFLFLVVVNAPLRKWCPGIAFSAAELATAIGMTMVSCAIPGSAMMKYTPAHLVAIWVQGDNNGSYHQLLDEINLPSWMFPTMNGTDVASRASDPVVRNYIGRAPVASDTFINHLMAVPWRAWRTPAVTWGILFGCIFGIAICMACVVHRQWSEVERLPFPLATLYASLIEPPARGHGFNALLRNRFFWVGLIIVFCAHGMNALHVYWPRSWPEIPLKYDIHGLTTEAPWKYLDPDVTKATISFTVVGLTYFIQQRIAFSIWACMLLLTIPRMLMQYTGTDFPGQGLGDELIGALVPYALTMLWVGRHEWAMVARRMTGRFRSDDPRSRFLPYGWAGWGFLLCTAGLFTWLMLAGASWMGTLMLVVFLLTLMLVLMRIVAETGLVAIQFLLPMYRPWQYVFQKFPSVAAEESTLKPYFLTCFFNVLFTVPQREPISAFVSQSLRTEDLAGHEARPTVKRGIAIVLALIGAMAVGYVSSGGSLLFYEYKYATTLDKTATSPINAYGVGDSATYALRDGSDLMEARAPREQLFSSPLHLSIGAGITTLLAVLQLRYSWWPIHPLGYLLLFSWPTWAIWYSVMWGWLLKTVILRLGGAKLFRSAKPFFIGLILGECGAAGFWLTISLIRLAFGLDYRAINVLPFL